jgi:hypothetical protein
MIIWPSLLSVAKETTLQRESGSPPKGWAVCDVGGGAFRCTARTVHAVCILSTMLPVVGAEMSLHSHGESRLAETELFQHLQTNWPGSVQRNREGEVEEVVLPPDLATDQSLLLLSKSTTLKYLTIAGRSEHQLQLTKAGVAALAQAPRLEALEIRCFNQLPDEVLEGSAQLRQLKELRLSAAYPRDARSYIALTNLVGLEKLRIGFAVNFGPDQLESLQTLESLSDLELVETGVDGSAWRVLCQFRALSRAVVISDMWRLVLDRLGGGQLRPGAQNTEGHPL